MSFGRKIMTILTLAVVGFCGSILQAADAKPGDKNRITPMAPKLPDAEKNRPRMPAFEVYSTDLFDYFATAEDPQMGGTGDAIPIYSILDHEPYVMLVGSFSEGEKVPVTFVRQFNLRHYYGFKKEVPAVPKPKVETVWVDGRNLRVEKKK